MAGGGGGALLAPMVGGEPGRVEAETVFAAARTGDGEAAAIVAEALRTPARRSSRSALVLNPEVVVVGGGVADSGDLIVAPLRQRLAQMIRSTNWSRACSTASSRRRDARRSGER